MLRTRLSTAAIALPTVLAVVISASTGLFSTFIGVLAAWSLYEIATMTRADAFGVGLIVLCGGIPAATFLFFGYAPLALPLVVMAMMGLLIVHVGRLGANGLNVNAWFVLLGALWVGVLFPFFAFLRNSRDGVALTIIMLLLVVASDSGAYFAGKAFGSRKLLPRVSPNKTVEGAIAGLGASILAGLILRRWLTPGLTTNLEVFLAFCVSLLAQIGDLANSAFKRVADVKDSGWLFPGHGGLLDRACSLVFAAVFTYYYSRSFAVG